MGGNRVKIDKNFQPKKCAKKRKFMGDADDDDRISQLPDDILVDILSLLSMKEAGRTSVLSSRWINHWKHLNSLDFDAQTPLQRTLDERPDRRKFKNESVNYVKWVNSVLQSHKSPTLKHFRLRFSLDITFENLITRWLQFAFSRQVQRLELDFPIFDNLDKYYPFPEKFLGLFEFKSLRALSLKTVSVSGQVIEFFLRNCPLLEQLTVDRPGQKIPKLEVCGSSLVLKHLDIGYVPYLESLKVSAPRLTSLKLMSCSLDVVLPENVPMLVDVSVICPDSSRSLKRLLSGLSCRISQLEKLTLLLINVGHRPDELCKFPEMPKLKKLVVQYNSRGDETLIRLASLTKASPYLQEFVVKNEWAESWSGRNVFDDAAATMPFRHEHLKVFKFGGYLGRPIDDALVRYILECCVVLEEIIIDPSRTCARDRLDVEQHLESQLLPRHVKLVVL